MHSISEQRAAVIAEARTWIGTPFHDGARVKGAGCDCGHLLLAVYEACGVLPPVDPGKWPRDWFMHAVNGEKYLGILGELGIEVPPPPARIPEPGDAVIWRYGHAFSHGALVTAWPVVIHCFAGRSVLEEDITLTPAFTEVAESETLRREVAGKPRPMKVFVPKRWAS